MSSIKYAENEISNSTSHEKKRERGRSKNIQLQKHLACNFQIITFTTCDQTLTKILKTKTGFKF